MNCYICLVETGCESRPALAICQHCGAGMCRTHLKESVVTPIVGLAGEARSILVCCRCSPLPLKKGSDSSKRLKEQGRPLGRNWWGQLWRHQPSALPEPTEAVAAVERFLNNQRS
jgi:hypothetical protein